MTILAATSFVQVYGCSFTFTLGPDATIPFFHVRTHKTTTITLEAFQAMTIASFDTFLQSFVAQC